MRGREEGREGDDDDGLFRSPRGVRDVSRAVSLLHSSRGVAFFLFPTLFRVFNLTLLLSVTTGR